jgi:uncharacterized protein YoxC
MAWVTTNADLSRQITALAAQVTALTVKVDALTATGVKIMADIDTLNTNLAGLVSAVGELTTAVTAGDTAIQTEIAALIQANSVNNSAAIKTAADNIATMSTSVAAAAQKINADTAAMVASLAPPPPPAPAP